MIDVEYQHPALIPTTTMPLVRILFYLFNSRELRIYYSLKSINHQCSHNSLWSQAQNLWL
jgi:hypothetical protein